MVDNGGVAYIYICNVCVCVYIYINKCITYILYVVCMCVYISIYL